MKSLFSLCLIITVLTFSNSTARAGGQTNMHAALLGKEVVRTGKLVKTHGRRAVANNVVDRAYLMFEGRVVTQGTKDFLLHPS